MRRILLAFLTTVAAVIGLFSYRTSTSHPLGVATTSAATSAGPGAGTSTSSSRVTPVTGSRTVTGRVRQTRWGPVQVQITVSHGRITQAHTLLVPNENANDAEINNYAVPVLVSETLQAQSANIDSVSGATFTSQGYIGSLQDALDQAGL